MTSEEMNRGIIEQTLKIRQAIHSLESFHRLTRVDGDEAFKEVMINRLARLEVAVGINQS